MSQQHRPGLTGRLQRAAGSGQRAVAAGLLPSRSRLRLAGRENGSDAFPAKSGSIPPPGPITGLRGLTSTRSSFTSGESPTSEASTTGTTQELQQPARTAADAWNHQGCTYCDASWCILVKLDANWVHARDNKGAWLLATPRWLQKKKIDYSNGKVVLACVVTSSAARFSGVGCRAVGTTPHGRWGWRWG